MKKEFPLKKNQEFTVTVESYTSEGLGVARIDGISVFIHGALRGEKCRIAITKTMSTYAYARLISVSEPSPERVYPACAHFGKCGGCHLLHMSYKEELQMKKERVQSALTRLGGLDIQVEEILAAEGREGYRNKAQYPVGADGKFPVHGFYRARSHEVIPVSRCLIQPPEADACAAAVNEWMRENGVPAYDELTGRGLIRHIYVRIGFGTGQTLVCLVANGDKLPALRDLIDRLQDASPGLRGLVLSVNRKDTNVVLGERQIVLWGDGYIEDTLCGLCFTLSPDSFYQINRAQAERLYGKALELAALGPEDVALDLYCGAGTITLCLARDAGQAIGAEIVPSAIADANKNAARNGIKNVRFIEADAGEAADKLASEGLRPNVIVLDPPRKGVAPQVVEAILKMSPERVVYVSCDPATLARDAALLAAGGYQPQRAVAVDMFPGCAHVETVLLMGRGNC